MLGWVVAAMIVLPSLFARWRRREQETIVDDGLGETMRRVWVGVQGDVLSAGGLCRTR